MEKKELLKELLVSSRKTLPGALTERDISLPVDSGKIITVSGVRRSGKSALLHLTMQYLLKQGVAPEQILFLNFDDERLMLRQNELDLVLQAYRELNPYIPMEKTYIFFDEIQESEGWELFVRRIYDNETRQIFITGSNSKTLSSEIATTLRGRTLTYEIFPLSFREYCRFRKQDTQYYDTAVRAQLKVLYGEYTQSAFPELTGAGTDRQLQILQEYYFVMLYRDMVERYRISNLIALKYFIRRLMTNIGKPSSINKIYNELKSAGITISKNSLYEWTEYLQNTYLFQALHRYENSAVKGLAIDRKFYCIDNGLRRTLIHTGSEDRGSLLENNIFLFLRSQLKTGLSIYYYKGGKECDFVVTDREQCIALIQVSLRTDEAKTLQREISGLLEASLALQCNTLYIVTEDTEKTISEDGKEIHVVSAWKFTLSFSLASLLSS